MFSHVPAASRPIPSLLLPRVFSGNLHRPGGFPPIVTPSPANPLGRTASALQSTLAENNVGVGVGVANDKGLHKDEACPTGVSVSNNPGGNDGGGDCVGGIGVAGEKDAGENEASDASKQQTTAKVYSSRKSNRETRSSGRRFLPERQRRDNGKGGSVELAEHVGGGKSPMSPPPGPALVDASPPMARAPLSMTVSSSAEGAVSDSGEGVGGEKGAGGGSDGGGGDDGGGGSGLLLLDGVVFPLIAKSEGGGGDDGGGCGAGGGSGGGCGSGSGGSASGLHDGAVSPVVAGSQSTSALSKPSLLLTEALLLSKSLLAESSSSLPLSMMVSAETAVGALPPSDGLPDATSVLADPMVTIVAAEEEGVRGGKEEEEEVDVGEKEKKEEVNVRGEGEKAGGKEKDEEKVEVEEEKTKGEVKESEGEEVEGKERVEDEAGVEKEDGGEAEVEEVREESREKDGPVAAGVVSPTGLRAANVPANATTTTKLAKTSTGAKTTKMKTASIIRNKDSHSVPCLHR